MHNPLDICLVEDSADARILLTLILESAGHRVHAAGTVQDALDDFPRWPCDVLLSDISLPDGTGCDMIRTLRQRGSTPYAIAMSGFGSAGDIAASLDAGFRHHLVKPFDIDALEHLIDRAVDELHP